MNRIRWQGVLIGAVALLAILAALAAWRAGERRRVQPAPILMYHHIGPAADSAWWVPPDVFERHLRSLREQGYTSIQPADLVAQRRWGQPLPRRPVIITFDDGYLDSLTAAEPLLVKYGFHGTVFLVTDCVGDSSDQRKQFEGADCLTWPEVRAMRARGVLTFGGHAHSHRNLVVANDPFSEARECYLQIKKQAGFKPDAFCYPHGEYNDRVLEAVRRAGWQTAMVCKDEVARTGPALDLLALPRVSVMGGRHKFLAARAPEKEAAGEIVFRVKHEGIPLEVAPRLPGAPDGGWLPPRELGNGAEIEWRWPASAPSAPGAPPALELWDRNRILRLYP
jgi:peptidoglycan/xylan/chitin deacetylase (PgdA/CDA1 family)